MVGAAARSGGAVQRPCEVLLNSGYGLRDTVYYDGLVEGDLYDGLPVDRLPIDAVGVPDEAHL